MVTIPISFAKLIYPLGFVGELALNLAVARCLEKGDCLFDLGDTASATKYYQKVAKVDDSLRGLGEAVDHARNRLESLGIECPPSGYVAVDELLESMPERDRHLKLARRTLVTMSRDISEQTRVELRTTAISHLLAADNISSLPKREAGILRALEAELN